jgi:hypothetical protein
MRVIAILVLSLALAAVAQAGPSLFEASFIMHAFGSKITPLVPSPRFLALPMGRACGATSTTATNYCSPALLTQGAPATGSGTISVGTGATASVVLPQSAFGIMTSGSLPARVPYMLRETAAALYNAAGSFFAGGGAAAGLGQRTHTGMYPRSGTWIINEGKNGFGGALGILGQFGAKQQFTITGAPGTFEGTTNWNMTQALGRTPYATVIGTGPMGTPLYQNPYFNTGVFTSVTPTMGGGGAVTTISKFGSGTLWTTGMVTMFATTGTVVTSFMRTGHDTTTTGGARNIQLVTPALTHWLSPSALKHTGHFGILNIRLLGPPDADGDTVLDSVDNCKDVPNAGSLFCDTDMDGYGNACDADLNNDGVVWDPDLDTFDALFSTTGASDGDLNCDLIVGGPDYAIFGLNWNGAPGPSGLACAGTVPCE